MRLTRQTEIAVGILLSCARRRRKVDTALAAREAGTTKDHAAQVVRILVKAGWIETHRGRQGGLSLAVKAETILLGEIIRRTQPSLSHCPSSDPDIAANPVLTSIVETASNSFLDLLDCFSVADLMAGETESAVDINDGQWSLMTPARERLLRDVNARRLEPMPAL